MMYRPVNINNVVEGFILAALILFVVLEEADWLCLSANDRSDELIEYQSSWSISKFFS